MLTCENQKCAKPYLACGGQTTWQSYQLNLLLQPTHWRGWMPSN